MIIFGTPTEYNDWIIGDDDDDLISGRGGTLIQEGNGSVDKEIFPSTVVPLTADDFSYF